MNELKVLIEQQCFRTSLGEVTLHPFKLKHFSKVLEMIEGYRGLFSTPEDDKEEQVKISSPGMAEFIFQKDQDTYKVLNDAFAFLTYTSDKDETFFEEMPYDEVIGLLTEAIQMNTAFFVRTMAKVVPKSENRKDGKQDGAGVKLSGD